MKAPNVQLKNVKTFRGMEGYGVNVDIHIDGLKCLLAVDEGNGGEMYFQEYSLDKDVKSKIKELEDYIETLPQVELELYNGKKTMIKVDLEWFINELLIKKDKEKAEKKMLKLFETAIVFGIPNANTYYHIKYPKPLLTYPIQYLQSQVNAIKAKHCTNGVQILNNNLEALGIIC